MGSTPPTSSSFPTPPINEGAQRGLSLAPLDDEGPLERGPQGIRGLCSLYLFCWGFRGAKGERSQGEGSDGGAAFWGAEGGLTKRSRVGASL